MEDVAPLTIGSIAQVFTMLGRAPASHPLIAVVAASWQAPIQLARPIADRRIVSALYAISLKRGDDCALRFGRHVFDGSAGSIVFMAPGQSFTPTASEVDGPIEGEAWTLLFDPALLRDRPLALAMPSFHFFSYAAAESLHLVDDEREVLTELVKRIDREATRPPDAFADDVLVAQLQLLFGYCQRFYARQARTRARALGPVAARLERHLSDYLASERPRHDGLPTVGTCARALGYSPDYLSDLLREETGENARDHIGRVLVEVAKARLLAGAHSVGEIAYTLGFEDPHAFSKLFKRRTGQSPAQWRRGA